MRQRARFVTSNVKHQTYHFDPRQTTHEPRAVGTPLMNDILPTKDGFIICLTKRH